MSFFNFILRVISEIFWFKIIFPCVLKNLLINYMSKLKAFFKSFNQGLARSASSLNMFQGFIAILGILCSKKPDEY